MKLVFVGGTGPLGRATVPRLLAAGHEVVLAHRGRREPDHPDGVEHLHGSHEELLAADGPVARLRPDAVVGTFGGGATARKAALLRRAAGDAPVVAVSSMDVYQHCVDAGIGDGSGAVDLPRRRIPLDESSARRSGPYPGALPGHDNVAAERALVDGGGPVTVLRPGAIYGPHEPLDPHLLREWSLVGRVHRGERRLALPDGGGQLFHRVALERVARAVVAAIERPPDGLLTCNVVDPTDLTYAALARRVAERLDWSWEIEHVRWPDGDHPWNTRHPVLACDRRLREVLGVVEPDPEAATDRTIDWLWERREAIAALGR